MLQMTNISGPTLGAETAKDLELSEQSSVLKDQIQKEREAAVNYQKELQVRNLVKMIGHRNINCVRL